MLQLYMTNASNTHTHIHTQAKLERSLVVPVETFTYKVGVCMYV